MKDSKKNMAKSNVVTGKEAIERMLDGVKAGMKVIRPTYGQKGCNAFIESEFLPSYGVVNDAFTMLEAVQVEGSVEKRGLNTLQELVRKANKNSRDGRKTTAIIGEEILEGGLKSDLQYMELKEELDALIPFVEKEIDAIKQPITLEEVHKVATVATRSEKLGRLIGEVYQKVGKDGIIQVEGSGTYNTYYEFTDGKRFQDCGFLSPYMVHDEFMEKQDKKPTSAIYLNPAILVTKRKISHLNDINPLLKALEEKGKKDLVIFTDDMDSGVASILVEAHKSKVINILIIKAPVLFKNFVFEDFARITGSTIVEDASGINFKNLKFSHLGTCERLVTDKDETIITGGQDISGYIEELKAKNDNDSLIRLQWLMSKSATIKIGSNEEGELLYLRLKAEDGVNASRLALIDGVVKGGGEDLFEIAELIPDTSAGKIIKKALKAPYKQICLNSGIKSTWYNPKPITFGSNIVDASQVIKNSVRNAIGMASTFLTAPIDIALPDKTPQQIAAEALKGKGLRF